MTSRLYWLHSNADSSTKMENCIVKNVDASLITHGSVVEGQKVISTAPCSVAVTFTNLT